MILQILLLYNNIKSFKNPWYIILWVFLFIKRQKIEKIYLYKNKECMKLKSEYLEYSVSLGRKRIYFIDLNEEQIKFWCASGYDWLFEKEPEVEVQVEPGEEVEDDDVILEQYLNEKKVEGNDFN